MGGDVQMSLRASMGGMKMEVLRREEGRGGTVRVPIAYATDIKNPDTMSFASDAFNLDTAVWDEVVRNFGKKPGPPPPFYFGHISQDERITKPAAGFVERVTRNGKMLVGDLFLNEEAWDKVVTQQGFRGFSVELDYNLKTPTGLIPGWMLTGGAITNDPALDVHFISAASENRADARVTLTTSADSISLTAAEDNKEEPSMADSSHGNEKYDALAARVAELEASKTADSEKIVLLEQQLAEAQQTAADAKTELAAGEVKQLVAAALSEGKMLPAQTEGYDKDPIAWLAASPFNGVKGLKLHLATSPVLKRIGISAVSTGRPSDTGEPAEEFQKHIAAAQADGKDYRAALAFVKAKHPDLYHRVAASYRGQIKEV